MESKNKTQLVYFVYQIELNKEQAENEHIIDEIFVWKDQEGKIHCNDKYMIRGITGVYTNRKDAIHDVINNVNDIWETCFNYAVVDGVETGSYGTLRERFVFRYNKRINKYVKCPAPKAFKGWSTASFVGL